MLGPGRRHSPDMCTATNIRRCNLASLVCSLIAFLSRGAAISMAASVVTAIARGQRLTDEAQRLAYSGAFDLVAWTAGICAVLLAFLGATDKTQPMPAFVFVAAVVVNICNFLAV